MTGPDIWSRRLLIGVTLVSSALPRTVAYAQVTDRGLGGTGAVPPDPDGSDRGIGGTGVVGTIRGFGSILVNGLRVTFPRSVPVRIDGRPARLQDLAIGHVVQVLARRHGTHLATRQIEVFSEVSGPIGALASDGFSVLGQKVIVPDAKLRRRWRIDRWVAVSGLRRLDGTIMASLIERRAPGVVFVSGPPRLDLDGTIRVGDLPIEALPGELMGQRLHLSGHLSEGRLMVARARPQWSGLLANRPDRLSVEDYVALNSDGTRFGSGLPSGDASASGFTDETLAVVSATVTPDGRVQIDNVRPEGGSRNSGAGFSSPRNGTPPGDPQGPPVRQRGGGADPDPGRNPGGPRSDQGSAVGRAPGRGGPGDGSTSGGGGPGRGGPGGSGPGRGGGSHP